MRPYNNGIVENYRIPNAGAFTITRSISVLYFMDHHSLMNSNSNDYIIALFLVSGVMSALLFTPAYSRSASNNSGESMV